MKQLESSIEQACVQAAKKASAVFLKIERRKGWPDRLLWSRRAVVPVFVELKREGKRATALQAHIHRELRSQGITVYIVRSTQDFKELL